MNPSHETALSLLEKARGDQLAYHALVDDSTIPTWLAGFHAEQAVEKALKSVLPGFHRVLTEVYHDQDYTIFPGIGTLRVIRFRPV